MFRFLTLAFIVFLLVCLSGCSGTTDTTNSNADQQPVSGAEFTDANLALAEGSRRLDNDETDKAIEVLSQAVKLNPDLAEAYFKLGVAYALVEARDAAVIEAQVTPTPLPGEKTPKPGKTNSEKAFEKAVEAYKKMLAANADDHAAHFNLGRAYNKLNEDENAAKSLKQAVKLNPEDTEYQTELGAILIKLAQYREAIEPLKKALELDPENSKAQELLEDAQAGRKRIDFTTVKKDDNKNTNSSANSNTNSQTTEANSKTQPSNSKVVKPPTSANKPN